MAVGPVKVDLASSITEDRLRSDVDRRLTHFESGGRTGIPFFGPAVVRETLYINKECRVDGRNIKDLDQLRRLRDYLDLRRHLRELNDIWGDQLDSGASTKDTVARAEELTHELRAVLAFFASPKATSLVSLVGPHRTALVSVDSNAEWRNAIDAVLATRNAREAEQTLLRCLDAVSFIDTPRKAHPCMRSLEDAVRTRDVTKWRNSWQHRERLRADKTRLTHRDVLLSRLDGICPQLAQALRDLSGDRNWRKQVQTLQDAWHWASALAWLERISDATAYKALVQDHHRVQQKIESATEKLVSLRAWNAFFERLTDRTMQSLQAWTKAVERIGQGTGKNAYRHRRSAQKYLIDCLPQIPAWIMPLHRLWDSVDAKPALFDTVIIDEASQAGGDALILMLLAKRIIVVGDDKQNSPEAPGVLEDDIVRLAREHLGQFHFRDEYRPTTSLFDHSGRAFGSPVVLREHFRCVPEIIRFSNDLCYADSPLIPLRQPPPQRLPPLRATFITAGTCEGTGQHIQNRAEAEAIVETIATLLEDRAYDGKTMGVITLQGHAQSRLIENLFAKKLAPKVIEKRRLRCGEPATFQGDQRDVVFLSLVMDPNRTARPLSGLPDERRFNVAMSRARDQVWLFYSVRPHDLNPTDLRHRLIKFFEAPSNVELDALYEDLERLERLAKGPRRLGNQPEPYDSWFEVDVAIAMLRLRYRIRRQVEVAGRRIDLVVEGLDARIAVECDGDAWHGPEQYDEDAARQRQLERAGWTFVRVRESEFYANREHVINEILAACAQHGIRPVDDVEETQSEPSMGSDSDVVVQPDDGDGYFIDPEGGAPGHVDDSASNVGPFTGYSKECGFPDPRAATGAEVKGVLRQIIERDGPLNRSSLYQLYVQGSPHLERVGKTVRQALDKAVVSLLRAGQLAQEDELGDASPEGLIIRLAGAPRVRPRPAGRRDLLDVPPSELLSILRPDQLANNSSRDFDSKVSRAILDHYGFTRLTKARKEYLSKVLAIGRRSGLQ